MDLPGKGAGLILTSSLLWASVTSRGSRLCGKSHQTTSPFRSKVTNAPGAFRGCEKEVRGLRTGKPREMIIDFVSLKAPLQGNVNLFCLRVPNYLSSLTPLTLS